MLSVSEYKLINKSAYKCIMYENEYILTSLIDIAAIYSSHYQCHYLQEFTYSYSGFKISMPRKKLSFIMHDFDTHFSIKPSKE